MTEGAATATEGAANSNGYISGSFTDQAPTSHSDLSLGRMFLFYKNLEGRVSRLEGKVYGNRLPGRVGVGAVEKDGGNKQQERMHLLSGGLEYNTIDPAMISSSSGTLLRSRNSSVASSSSDFSMLISPTITDAKELRVKERM